MLCLKKKLSMPKALESWKYCDPLKVLDHLMSVAKKQKRLRELKHRRIAALTRKAMQHE